MERLTGTVSKNSTSMLALQRWRSDHSLLSKAVFPLVDHSFGHSCDDAVTETFLRPSSLCWILF